MNADQRSPPNAPTAPANPFRWKSLSLAALLAANLVPLVGVIAFDWDLRGVLLVYWAENVVVGLYAIARMIFVGRLAALGLSLFFCFHFGLFMFVHLIFLLGLTSEGFIGNDAAPPAGDETDFFDAGAVLRAIPWLGVAALMLSHGISFIREFWLAGEWQRTDIRTEMARPYPRLVVMHIAIIAGGFVVVLLGQPTALLAVLVVLKTAIDGAIHVRDHAARQNGNSPR